MRRLILAVLRFAGRRPGDVFPHPAAAWWGLLLLAFLLCPPLPCLRAGTLSDPAVDAFNVRLGSQTFSPLYHFTTNTALVETALVLRDMGSDIVKFAASRNTSPYGISLPPSVTSLSTLALNEPSFRQVFGMPFRHYLLWAYCFSAPQDAWWKNGASPSQLQLEYNEIYEFAACLLTNYNNTGKRFYLGHWEGDWYLLPGHNVTVNPSTNAIQGMIDWLNTRQRAVDDARRNIPHTNVDVFVYAEANRVRDAMLNPPASNQRVINAVVPYVTNLDYVSWSSYDGMELPAGDLWATLNYMESQMTTAKAAAIPGRRVFIGEYGWGGTQTSEAQEPTTRAFLQKLLPWRPPFILFWQTYDNEGKAYWLVDSNHVQTPCYFLHQRFLNLARLRVAQFRETQGRLPTDEEFAALATPLVAQPLPAPVRLSVANLDLAALSAHAATLQGQVTQGLYGDDQAVVRVYWGRQDGGVSTTGWEQSADLGTNRLFNPATFSLALTNLLPKTNYHYRFYATNSGGGVWAPASGQFSTDVLDPREFGCRMKITLSGYNRGEPLTNFPVLVALSTNIPGFSYRGFASKTGGDLRFADFTGARLVPHEIDEWNTNGTSTVWVRMPLLTNPTDALWAFWGNPAATNPPATSTNGAVWSQGFEVVWHLKESALPFADSARKHPAAVGTIPASTTAGLIGRGATFNGTSQYLSAGAISLGDRFTLSAWVKLDPSASSIRTLWANKAGGSSTAGFAQFVNSWGTTDQKLLLETGNGAAAAYAGTDTNQITASQWHLATTIIDRTAGTARMLVDGVDRTAPGGAALTDFANTTTVGLGRFTDGSYYFKGVLDEARIETDTRSTNWVWAAWMTVASNAAFAACSPVTVSAPTMTLAPPAAGSLRLGWSGSGVGFSLYTATNLAQSVWDLATNQPFLVNAQWQVQIPVEARPGRFFRLKGP